MNKPKFLSIGCGKTNLGSDWVHIDGNADYKHALHHTQLDNLPFKDKSFNLIYASHVIPYFDRQEAVPILKEWKRVLNTNGILRLTVVDFSAICHIYYNHKPKLEELLGPLYGRIMMDGKYICYRTIYDLRDITKLLKNVGFKDIKQYNWRTTPPHDKIDDQSRAYWPKRPELYKSGKFTSDQIHLSLNIECRK